MPTFPKSNKRPWRNPPAAAQSGRKEKTNFYWSTTWRRFRANYILNHPLCTSCQAKGIVKEGNVLDHIKQINRKNPYDTEDGKYGKPLSDDNVQTMCTHCHAVKSGKERHKKT